MGAGAAHTGWMIDTEVWTCPVCGMTRRPDFHRLTPPEMRQAGIRQIRDNHICLPPRPLNSSWSPTR